MMIPLVLYILDHVGSMRLTHGKDAVSVLPSKVAQKRKFLMDPVRTVGFYPLRDLAGSKRGRGTDKCMNMIFDAADVQSRRATVTGDSADVRPNSVLNIGRNQVPPIFRAENEMIVTMGKCVCHITRRYATRTYYRTLSVGQDPRLQSKHRYAMKKPRRVVTAETKHRKVTSFSENHVIFGKLVFQTVRRFANVRQRSVKGTDRAI